MSVRTGKRVKMESAMDRARWILEVARIYRAGPFPAPKSAEWAALENKACAFAGLRRWAFGSPATLEGSVRPELSELGHVLTRLARGERHMVRLSKWTGYLSPHAGGLRVGSELAESPWRDVFWLRVYETLAAVQGRLRFCARERCGRPFLAVKRQRYCAGHARSAAERNRAYYQKHREELLKRRARAYDKRHLPAKVTPQGRRPRI